MKYLRFCVCLILLGVLIGAGKGDADLPIKSGQTIVFLGDSITVAGEKPNGYASLVVAGLKANSVEVKSFCQGASGANSANMSDERSMKMMLARKADWLTISCGVNDGKKDGNFCPLDKFKDNITAIIDKAQAAKMKVMILTTTRWEALKDNDYTRKGITQRNADLDPYNETLRTLAKEKNCLLADVNVEFERILKTNFNPNGVLTLSDGVHPNDTGHQAMAGVVLKAFGLDDAQLEKAKAGWPAPSSKPSH